MRRIRDLERNSDSEGSECALAALAGGIALASFAATLVVHKVSPDAAFYLTPMRMFELAAGASFAAATFAKPLPVPIARVAGPVGVALLAASLVQLDERLAWPSLYTLLPVVATLALIVGGASTVFVRALLETRLLRSIGRASYSLYLVHWPLIAFARGSEVAPPSPLALAGLLASVFVFGFILHHVVERPFRLNADGDFAGPWIAARQTVAARVIGFATVGVVAGSVVITATDGLPARTAKGRTQQPADTLDFAGDLCDARKHQCTIGDPMARSVVYVLGDSHALNLVAGLDALFRAERIRGLVHFDHGCLLLPGTTTFAAGRADTRCHSNAKAAFSRVAGDRAPVILALDYAGYQGAAADVGKTVPLGLDALAYAAFLQRHMSNALSTMQATERRIVLFGPAFATTNDVAACRQKPGGTTKTCRVGTRADAMARTAHIDKALADLSARWTTVTLLDQRAVFCLETHCIIEDERGLFLRDTAHLTTHGSRVLIDRLREPLLRALAR